MRLSEEKVRLWWLVARAWGRRCCWKCLARQYLRQTQHGPLTRGTTLHPAGVAAVDPVSIGPPVSRDGRRGTAALAAEPLATARWRATTACCSWSTRPILCPTRLLEELRALTNITANGQVLVSLVLAGKPALEERFSEPELDAFSQRISQRCYLAAFGREETFQYLQSQVLAAGIEGRFFRPGWTRSHLYGNRWRAEACQSTWGSIGLALR